MNRRASRGQSEWLVMVLSGLLLLLQLSVSQGQTTSITSSGLNTHVSHVAGQPNYDITGGTRPGNGTNLFHSFGDFSVGTDQVARFLNDSGRPTTNILSRVTGGHVSNIFGEINTTNFPGANLYLINPAGVLFGPTATLNVSGSVHVSTADYLRLADGLRFNAIPGPQDTLLSQAPVVAFGFLHAHPRPITVQGSQLTVPDGKSLSLVGGDIKVTGGTLTAHSGQITLASLAGRGEARVAPEGLAIAERTHRGQIVMKGGTEPENVARLDTSGEKGGAVVIRGGKLSLVRAEVTTGATGANQTGGGVVIEATKSATFDSVALHTGGVTPDPSPNLGGGAVSLTAPTVRASNLSIDTSGNILGSTGGHGGDVAITVRNLTASNSRISGNIAIHATGDVTLQSSLISTGTVELQNARNIAVRAATLTLTDSGISSSPIGGRAGDIVIDVGRLTMRGTSGISAGSFENTTRGGDISVSAREAILIDGGRIRTSQSGRQDGGSITLSTPDLILDHGGSILTRFDGARAGDISVNVRTLNMFNGGRIGIEDFGFGGSSGNINIVAFRSISMAGMGTRINIFRDNSTVPGNVHLVTPTLHLDDGAVVSTSQGISDQAGRIVLDVGHLTVQREARVESTGQGGSIVINAAKNITLDKGTITAAGNTDQGGNTDQAGNVSLHAGKSIELRNGSLISADNRGTGDIGSPFNAGHIVIQAGKSVVSRDSTVSAQAQQGNGGTIDVDAKNVTLTNSQLTTSVSGGPQTVGGRISVDAKQLTLTNSQILSTATEGQGGTINIRSHTLHRDPRSVIDASSESGTDGTVTIESRH